MNNPVRIMLVEDQAAYREVISLSLKREASVELTSQFGTAEFALRALQYPKKQVAPDLILLDLNLPGMSGLEAIPWIRKYSPDTKIIILTQSDAEADVLQAIQAGASGYLLKSASPAQITDSIQTVMDGGAPLDAGVASFILDTLQSKLPKTKPKAALSVRELEILSLLANGHVKKEIATQLAISPYTVVYHVKHIYEKLEAVNAPAAISKAYQHGILPRNHNDQ
jgi:DNA-binding NarL/FixJ family response regulator